MASSSTSAPPTTRSRTLLFLSFRDSRAGSSRFRRPRTPVHFEDAPGGEDEHDRLIATDAAHVAIDAELPPRWYDPGPPYVSVRLLTFFFSRADIASQVEDILASTQTKSASPPQSYRSPLLRRLRWSQLIQERFDQSLLSISSMRGMSYPGSRTGLWKKERLRLQLPKSRRRVSRTFRISIVQLN